jgi:hypothetical protein
MTARALVALAALAAAHPSADAWVAGLESASAAAAAPETTTVGKPTLPPAAESRAPGELFATGLRDFVEWAHPSADGCEGVASIDVVSRFPGGLRARYEIVCHGTRRGYEAILETREGTGVWQVSQGFETDTPTIAAAVRARRLQIPKETLPAAGEAVSPPPDNPGDTSPLDAVATPEAVRQAPPQFPEEAGRARLIGEARVAMLVDVSPEGEPKRARTLRGPDPDLGMRQAAIAAVLGWHFRPATLMGKPVRYFAPIEITFTGLPSESRLWSHRALFDLQVLSYDDATRAEDALRRLRAGEELKGVAPESALDSEWGLMPASALSPALRKALHEARVGSWSGPIVSEGRHILAHKRGEVYYAILPPASGSDVQYQIVHQRGIAESEALRHAIDDDIAAFMAERHRRDFVNEAAQLMGIHQTRSQVGQLVIHSDVLDDDETALLRNVVDATFRAHQEFWAGIATLRLFRQPVLVYAFQRRSDQQRVQQLWRGRHGGGASAVGEYLPASRILSFPCEPAGGHVPIPIAIHEAVHMLDYERVYGARVQPSKWFEEGMANYFGFSQIDSALHLDVGAIRRSGTIIVGHARVQFDPRTELREHLRLTRDEGPVPLLALLSASPDDPLWSGERSGRAYGAAWTLVHFLIHGDHGRREAAFRQYAGREAAGRGGLQAFQELFGSDLTALEAEWHDYEATL